MITTHNVMSQYGRKDYKYWSLVTILATSVFTVFSVCASADPMSDLQAELAQLAANKQSAQNAMALLPGQQQPSIGSSGLASILGSAVPPAGGEGDAASTNGGNGAAQTPPRDSRLQEVQPDGKLVLLQGVSIPAVLINGINSDLPSDLRAMVTSDVYDSIEGYTLLIPKGSVLIASAGSDVEMGAERMACKFTRIILPDGAYVNLGNMSGTDGQGYSGLDANVNNHFWKQFGAGMLLAFVTYEGSKSSGSTSTDLSSGVSSTPTMANSAGTEMTDITSRIMDRYKDLKPTLTVTPGTKIWVMVNKDIVMQAYQD